jgi:dienelactone hydrolase
MNTPKRARLLAAAFSAAFIASMGAFADGTSIKFSSLDRNHPYKLSGTLFLPANSPGPCPALVVVHGTTGIDSRNEFYRGSILKLGIATFEVDFKTGIYTGPLNRPSPEALLPMGFAALKELRKLPSIDPNRIGIMGFSMGGHLAVDAAFESSRKLWMGDEKGFAAHVGFYPVVKTFLKLSDCRVTGAPMIILYGTEDVYGDGKNAPQFKLMLMNKCGFAVTTVEYAGAQHGFNRNAPPMRYVDPAANGWKGYTEWNEGAANDSIKRVVDFLGKNLAAK